MHAVILDLDGVLRRGRTPIEGSVEAVKLLNDKGVRICYLTNNSTRSRDVILEELSVMGYPAAGIISSAQAAGKLICERSGPSRCLVVGEQGLVRELEDQDHEVFEAGNADGDVTMDYVVAGLDRAITYTKIVDALRAIRDGAVFIATNRDPTLPIEGGGVAPGAGTIISAIETCSGTAPIVVGKPETYSTGLAIEELDMEPWEVLMVGDRPDTDILAGKRAGCNVAMVLTGDSDKPADADHPVYRDLLSLVSDQF